MIRRPTGSEEAGVIGKPDPLSGEIVKAAPREIAFDEHLPKNKAGKIMRRLLRARELGLDESAGSSGLRRNC
jgi:acetyl-CoA synthetase